MMEGCLYFIITRSRNPLLHGRMPKLGVLSVISNPKRNISFSPGLK